MYGGQGSSTNRLQKSAKTSGKINVAAGTSHRLSVGVTLRDKVRGDLLQKRRMKDDYFADPNSAMESNNTSSSNTNTLPSVMQQFSSSMAPPDQTPEHVSDPFNPLSYNSKTLPELVPLELLPTFVEMAQSNDPAAAFHGVLMIRKLLSVTVDPPIRHVVESGVLPRLVEFLQWDHDKSLQFEAAWAVSNIASGGRDDTYAVVELGALDHFVRLLECPHDEIREQATWAVGNIATESVELRDLLLSMGSLRLLVASTTFPTSKLSLIRNTVWAISNLCRSKPLPALHIVSPALPTLTSLLSHHDREVATDACWAISYICEGTVDRIQSVIQCGALKKIISMVSAPAVTMQIPALRTIGNVAAGNDLQTQTIVELGALDSFHFLLNHPRRAIKKEACWCLSNICAGAIDQVQAVIKHELYPVIIRLLDAPEYEIKKEAIWCIANTTSGGSRTQLRYLVDIGVIVPLCRALTLHDIGMLSVALEALENFLQLGETERVIGHLDRNIVADQILACGGTDWIELLQQHNSPELYAQSKAVIETFFEHRLATREEYGVTDEDESHNQFNNPSSGWGQPPSNGGRYDFS